MKEFLVYQFRFLCNFKSNYKALISDSSYILRDIYKIFAYFVIANSQVHSSNILGCIKKCQI